MSVPGINPAAGCVALQYGSQEWVPESWQTGEGRSEAGEYADLGRSVLVAGHFEKNSKFNFAALGPEVERRTQNFWRNEFPEDAGWAIGAVSAYEAVPVAARWATAKWAGMSSNSRTFVYATIVRIIARITGVDASGMTRTMPKYPDVPQPAPETTTQPYSPQPLPLPPGVNIEM
jgi:hypothetical protein